MFINKKKQYLIITSVPRDDRKRLPKWQSHQECTQRTGWGHHCYIPWQCEQAQHDEHGILDR